MLQLNVSLQANELEVQPPRSPGGFPCWFVVTTLASRHQHKEFRGHGGDVPVQARPRQVPGKGWCFPRQGYQEGCCASRYGTAGSFT